jgi:nucleotide-binding universal stress UspA family protein
MTNTQLNGIENFGNINVPIGVIIGAVIGITVLVVLIWMFRIPKRKKITPVEYGTNGSVFHHIFVPAIETNITELMHTACKIAKHDGALITTAYIIEVPMTLPLEAVPKKEIERGERLLKAAETVAGEYDLAVDAELIQARFAGRAIVEKASQLQADLVLMGAPRSAGGDIGLTQGVKYVLRNAPCRVWTTYVPKAE